MKIAYLALAAGLTLASGAAEAANAPALKITQRIAGPDGSWDYANFDPVHRRLYVAHGAMITAIDVDSGKVTGSLLPAQRAHIALPLPGGDEVLVTNGGSNTAVLADAMTGAVRATVPTGKSPDAALIEPTTGLGMVMNGHGGDITLIDLKAGQAVGTISVGGTLEFGVADGLGRVFVNIEDTGEIAVIDMAARKVTAHWKMDGCEEPSGLAYSAKAKVLISACANGVAKAVSAVDGKIVSTLKIGPKPDAAFFDASRDLAYIPSGGDGTLAVIAVRGPHDVAVVGEVATQAGSRTGAIDPTSGKIFLPSAKYDAPAKAGERPVQQPGTFAILVLDR
jgi:YVTN family beta-propeller protein